MRQKIIISGHSSGLGKALAEYYLQRGIPVLGISRRALPEQAGLQQCALDLSDGSALAEVLQNGLLDAFIDDADEAVLINNAGTVAPNALCGRQRPSEILTAVQLNIAAPLLLSNDLLARQREGMCLKIVHISSGAGRKAYIGWSVYGATKAALDQHAQCVAAEGKAGVGIISLAPGVVDTDMQAQIRAQSVEDFPLLARFQQLKTNHALSTPQTVAAKIAAIIADRDFGSKVIGDVRDWKKAGKLLGFLLKKQ
ncbi:SDR family NAD(P)-dependent oxidoreductase [Neisseria perflava]|uniref:SDR family NAD(P)-dependent oxidoreductase n=1 Tax=Neisseria perflava TaxID=33053 RepID=UPI00209FBC0E|nr:SDR family NAD(P)-dependent oxidoreductase [Neisseria perflava]MCP1660221.1 NADP-dependent 3-hydroxy acid dehydrogenase YdfG [Neisseria perflava]MCP1771830.1 NADP-dependent 3-hydroxy acid dehydrogenase YdfG [Neisseria perflava]